MTKQKERSC